MKKRILLCALMCMFLGLAGCKTAQKEEAINYNQPLLPGENALVKITNPEDIPDFSMACNNVFGLETSINYSLNYLSKPSSERYFPICGITHDKVRRSLREFKKLLHANMTSGQMNQAIREKFDVYMSVGCDKRGTVLYTGYYTPIFNGSLQRTDRFKYPLYKKPADLMVDNDGNVLGRKLANGSTAMYPSRAEIEGSNMLTGTELAWLENPFEVYIAHVQGSAKIRLEDGKLITVGYAGTNGHEYNSISKGLSEDGAIPLDKMSLSAMIDYFATNPEDIAKYVNRNPRFVFFRKSNTNPTGSINEPVTTLRTIATDKSIFPRAAITMVQTDLPRAIGSNVEVLPYSGFTLDQDTGGAIRAAGRCDVYMGQGDEAGLVAGKTYQEGRLYYLFLKD